MFKKISLIWIMVLMFFASAMFAANLTVATVTGDVEYRVGQTNWQKVAVDSVIPEGAMIRVNGAQDSVTLSMPDGSELHLIGMTSISIKDVLKVNASSRKQSIFQLLAGKLFAKVNRKTGEDFKVETQTAVAAVRGTEFGVDLENGQGHVVVKKGTVEVSDPAGVNPPVMVKAGMFSAFSPGAAFTAPKTAPRDLYTEFNETAPATANEQNGQGETVAPENPPSSQQETPAPAPGGTKKASVPGECSSKGVNWSVSSENIDGKVWNKLLLSPTLELGNVNLALYLTLYFQNFDDLMNRTLWYNADEWNFGITPNTPFQFGDFLHDLLLKIRYMSYKSPKDAKTKILLRLGAMPNMTLSQGLLIDNYANDTEFPAVRHVGLQYNMDFGKFGFETLVGDIFNAQMAGLHLYFRPFFGKAIIGNISFGISGFADYDPLSAGSGSAFGYAADILYPIFDVLGVSMNIYTEAGTLGYMLPFQKAVAAKGWGLTAGLKGKIIIIDYRAEFRSFHGGFEGGYVNAFYDGNRAARLLALASPNPTNYNGFLIEAGRSWKGIGGVSLKFEQLFPSGNIKDIINAAPNNYVHIEAFIDKCLIKKVYGKFSYDRENFAPGDFFKGFFGDGVVLTTQLYYMVSDGVYIGTTVKKYYQNGTTKNTYSLETRIGL